MAQLKLPGFAGIEAALLPQDSSTPDLQYARSKKNDSEFSKLGWFTAITACFIPLYRVIAKASLAINSTPEGEAQAPLGAA